MFRRYVTDVTGNDKRLSRNERTLVIIYIYIIKSIDNFMGLKEINEK